MSQHPPRFYFDVTDPHSYAVELAVRASGVPLERVPLPFRPAGSPLIDTAEPIWGERLREVIESGAELPLGDHLEHDAEKGAAHLVPDPGKAHELIILARHAERAELAGAWSEKAAEGANARGAANVAGAANAGEAKFAADAQVAEAAEVTRAAEVAETAKVTGEGPNARGKAGVAGALASAAAALFDAFFVEGLDIGRIDVLVGIGTALGFDASQVKVALDLDIHTQELADISTRAGARGIVAPRLTLASTPCEGCRSISGFLDAGRVASFLAGVRPDSACPSR